ncbi:MAG: FHA domain-containing protein [Planctomycetota bacterium]
MASKSASNQASGHRQWTMGASPQCDVWLNVPSVSGTHCRFETSANRDSRSVQMVVEDLDSTNGTYVRHQRIEAPTAIDPSTRVTLGSSQPLPWPTPIGAKQVVNFGSGDDNDLVIDQPGVSASHGRLILGPMDTLVIEDLQSTNGIRIVGSTNETLEPSHRIHQAALVERTATLLLGSTPLQVAALLAVKQTKSRADGKSPPASVKSTLPKSSTSSSTANASGAPATRGVATSERLQIGLIAGVVIAVLMAGVGAWLLLRDTGSLAKGQSSDDATMQRDRIENPPASSETSIVSGSRTKQSSGVGPSSDFSSTTSLDHDAWKHLDDPRQAALFHVMVQADDGLSSFRVGTAWAIDDQHLLTSAMVVKVMEMQQEKGFPKSIAVHAATGDLYSIHRARKHPSFESELAISVQAVNEFEAAKAASPQPSDSAQDAAAAVAERGEVLRQLAENMLRRRTAFATYDVASLQLGESLPPLIPRLRIASESVLRPNQKLILLASPFDAEDPYYDSSLPVAFENTTWTVEGLQRDETPDGRSHPPRLILSGPPKPPSSGGGIPWNRFGSPLVDAAGRVISIFSTPTNQSSDASMGDSTVLVEGPSAAVFGAVID